MVRYGGGTSSEIYFVSKNGKNITQDIKDRVNEAISYPQKIDGGIYIYILIHFLSWEIYLKLISERKVYICREGKVV